MEEIWAGQQMTVKGNWPCAAYETNSWIWKKIVYQKFYFKSSWYIATNKYVIFKILMDIATNKYTVVLYVFISVDPFQPSVGL